LSAFVLHSFDRPRHQFDVIERTERLHQGELQHDQYRRSQMKIELPARERVQGMRRKHR
jgi:hypothetical protein